MFRNRIADAIVQTGLAWAAMNARSLRAPAAAVIDGHRSLFQGLHQIVCFEIVRPAVGGEHAVACRVHDVAVMGLDLFAKDGPVPFGSGPGSLVLLPH